MDQPKCSCGETENSLLKEAKDNASNDIEIENNIILRNNISLTHILLLFIIFLIGFLIYTKCK